MKLKYFILIMLFLPFITKAQFSKTHYIPPITAQNNIVEDQYLYISTPTLSNVNFRIIEIGGNIISGSVRNNLPYVHPIGNGTNSQLFIPKTSIGIIQNKGYIIEAEDLIYVSVRVTSQRNVNPAGVVSYAHAGGLVSKGNSALGKEFRLGAMLNPLFDTSLLNFASILSTENGTKVTISNIPYGTILADGTTVSAPIIVTLNKNESYVLALENQSNTVSNSSKMIGALVKSDKPVVVNSGSFGGSNSSLLTPNNQGVLGPAGRDVGFDQIVGADKIGKEYIFVKGNGTVELERVLLIAHKPQTVIYLNDISTPFIILNNPGDFVVIDGSNFINENLYVSTSQNVFAYQSIGGSSSPANQNLFFVPPLNCSTPNIVDNIPKINEIGNINNYIGVLNIVTEIGASVTINNIAIANPIPIVGNLNYVRYTVSNLTGNISIKSTKQVYVSYYGNSGVATYGGYYSGFDTKPEIVYTNILTTTTGCMPNIELKVTEDLLNTFQWLFNGVDISGATLNTFTPSLTNKGPGYYQVRKNVLNCGTTTLSDEIPVSDCPIDTDGDGVNNNIDIDNDNDGITNCTESYGDQPIDVSSTTTGIIAIGNYNNQFTSTTMPAGTSTNTFSGNADGSFTTALVAGKTNAITYKLDFNKLISIGLKYNPINGATISSLSNGEFVIKSDTDKTITVLNPSNQLLIDTNYDGNYRLNVPEYSSFEIRFRLNGPVLLPTSGTAPAIDFKFQTYLSNSISFTHKNLSDTDANNANFSFYAICVPNDSDGDGIPDQLDIDSDNDGIPDTIEAQGIVIKLFSGVDTNNNGLDNNFEPGFTPIDTDLDRVPDYLDLDSDNDGIYDEIETGSLGTDTDGDGIKNYRDLDSDNDLCNDVIEAGFTDLNNDGILGPIAPPTVNANGVVTSGTDGYTSPNPNYLLSGLISINTQPIATEVCEQGTTLITIQTNVVDSYKWQISINNGITWNTLVNNATYDGIATNQLQISNATLGMNNYQYRVFLNKTGNTCGLYSNAVILTVNPLPIVQNAVLFQCDDDTDGFSYFNLNEANQLISLNYANETFTFYTTQLAAENADSTFKIANPIAYNANSQFIWARIESNKLCYRTAQIEIKVSTTNIPIGYMHNFEQCDDFNGTNGSDIDGVTSFNFSNVEADLRSILPPTNQPITILFYRNLADALAEQNAITDTANYRNIGYPNQQNIYIRIDSNIDNECLGLGHHVTLTVNPIPIANPVNNLELCDDISDGNDANGIVQTFDLGSQTAKILGSQSPTDYTLTYHDNPADVNSGANPLPLIYENSTNGETIYVRIVNILTTCVNPHLKFDLIVNPLPIIKTPTPLQLCDDSNDSDNRNGIVQSFNLDSKNSEILNGLSPTRFIVTCHLNLSDANNGTNALISPYTNINRNQTLFVRVTNNITNCYNTKERLDLIVNPLPTINPILDFELCDDAADGIDNNGFRTFDLESKTATILGSQTASNFKVTYHRSQNDANTALNSLISPFTNEVKNQQRIYIRILNLITGCYIADYSFNIIVKQKPVFEVDTEQIVCLNNLPLTLRIKTSLEPYSFNWFDSSGTLLASDTTSINITKGGKYTVTTSNTLNCDRSIDINVKESIIATITLDNITIEDDSNNNSITINNNNQEIGIGDYEYALDNGSFQEPFFDLVSSGIHTIYVRDKNDCGLTSIDVSVIGYPKFFTPNGDTYNDYWTVTGVNENFYPNSLIYIFDRFGKLITKINTSSKGWDGTFNGEHLPSSDYWFSVELVDLKGNIRVKKGHFSLIRR